jgi:hypothetical protein
LNSIFYKPRRLTELLIILLVFCGVFLVRCGEDRPLYAQTSEKNSQPTTDQSFSKAVGHFIKSLRKAPKEEGVLVFGRYREIVAREISMDKLYVVSYQDVENLLNQAASGSIDSLTLFSHPLLQDQKRFAIVFNKELLTKINSNFNFHALFNISILAIDGGSDVKMIFFVIGQGKIIVGYNRNAKIKHPDYNLATGNYDYKELFIMDVNRDAQGNRGIFNIKGRSTPQAKPRWMKGPLNYDIHSMVITSDAAGHRQILTEYEALGMREKFLPPIPIEKLYHAKNR